MTQETPSPEHPTAETPHAPPSVQLGQIAVDNGFLTREQLYQALFIQRRHKGKVRIGDILVRKRWLTVMQWEEVVAHYRKNLEQPSESTGEPQQVSLLGRIAVQKGLLTQEQLAECVRLQGIYEARGKLVRLGELLVHEGYLSREQVLELLCRQKKVLLRCCGCGKQYNVVRPQEGKQYTCPDCGMNLVSPDEAGDVSADGSFVPAIRGIPKPPEQLRGEAGEEAAAAKAPAEHKYRAYARRRRYEPSKRPLALWKMAVSAAILAVTAAGAAYWLLYVNQSGPSNTSRKTDGQGTVIPPPGGAQNFAMRWATLDEFTPRSRRQAAVYVKTLQAFAQEAGESQWGAKAKERAEETQASFFPRRRETREEAGAEQVEQPARSLEEDLAQLRGELREIESTARTGDVRLAVGQLDAIADLWRIAETTEGKQALGNTREQIVQLAWEAYRKIEQVAREASTPEQLRQAMAALQDAMRFGVEEIAQRAREVCDELQEKRLARMEEDRAPGPGSSPADGDASSYLSGPCPACNETGTILCSTCSGKGSVQGDCPICGGAGEMDCSTCTGDGEFVCETCDKKGRVVYRGEFGRQSRPHRYCSSRHWIRCDNCGRSGRRRCPFCQDSGRLYSSVCQTCRGAGRLRCSTCRRRPERCKVCQNAQTIPCRHLELRKEERLPKCGRCFATGRVRCSRCKWFGRIMCTAEGCAGTGKVLDHKATYYQDGWVDYDVEEHLCDRCEGKGYSRCQMCIGGYMICHVCEGIGYAWPPCAICGESGELACPACQTR